MERFGGSFPGRWRRCARCAAWATIPRRRSARSPSIHRVPSSMATSTGLLSRSTSTCDRFHAGAPRLAELARVRNSIPAARGFTKLQAIMDFGALQCTPRVAPLRGMPAGAVPGPGGREAFCRAPCQSRAGPGVRDRWFHYLHVTSGDRTLLPPPRASATSGEGLSNSLLLETRTRRPRFSELVGDSAVLLNPGAGPRRGTCCAARRPMHQLHPPASRACICGIRNPDDLRRAAAIAVRTPRHSATTPCRGTALNATPRRRLYKVGDVGGVDHQKQCFPAVDGPAAEGEGRQEEHRTSAARRRRLRDSARGQRGWIEALSPRIRRSPFCDRCGFIRSRRG